MSIKLAAAYTSIRQLHARYTDAVWRRDIPTFLTCFTPDAEWLIGGRTRRGTAEIEAFILQIFEDFRHIQMRIAPPILDLGGGRISGRSLVVEQRVSSTGESSTVLGVYYDRCVGEGPDLKFEWRLFQAKYVGENDLTSEFRDLPDPGPSPLLPSLG
jgi:hypothetical protein